MDKIIDLLFHYWKPIVGLLFTIVGFVIALIKKKPINDILTDIYYYAVKAVISSETIRVNGEKVSGEQKLRAAVATVCIELQKKYPTLAVENYQKLIEKIIEDLLSTPQKKG